MIAYAIIHVLMEHIVQDINEYLCKEDIICENYYNYDLTECFDEIPLGYYLRDPNLRTIDKCNIKCLNCTLESNENDLCISCNINESYYPKYKDSSNNNSFINCYKDKIDDYYFDKSNSIYMPCYSICKECNWKGDDNQNNCTSCYDNYILSEGNCLEIINTEILENITYNFYGSSTNSIYLQDSTKNINEYYTTYYINDTYFTSINFYDSKSYKPSLSDNYFSNISISNDSTIINIEYYINEFLKSYNLSNYNYYYYEINLNENVIENNYSNVTFIEFPPDSKSLLINNFNLDINDNIYILIIETLYNDLNSAVKNFDYKIFLENGTILDINEDIYVDIYFPLIDLALSNYNYSIYFAEQGYDIYNKSDKFYNDKCSSAYLYHNDITIQDRKNDIYPNNVILCKDNCDYKANIIEEKRIICDCNLNINKNFTKINVDFPKEAENGNFFIYFLENINYKILKCYNLLTSFKNLKNNYALFSGILIILFIIFINIIFWVYGISKIRKIMIKQIPTFQRVYNDYVREVKRLRSHSSKSLLIPPKKIKKNRNKKTKKNYSHNKTDNFKWKTDIILSYKNIELIDSSKFNIDLNKKIQKTKTMKNYDIEQGNYSLNQLPYSQAIRKDKRNIFSIFISVIIEKLELVNLIIGQHKIKIVLIYQYTLSLLIDLFFNAFFILMK